jgi:hypothetical protein
MRVGAGTALTAPEPEGQRYADHRRDRRNHHL